MIKELSRKNKIGDMVKYETIGGGKVEGELVEWDSNVAIIKVTNKLVDHPDTFRAVEC